MGPRTFNWPRIGRLLLVLAAAGLLAAGVLRTTQAGREGRAPAVIEGKYPRLGLASAQAAAGSRSSPIPASAERCR